ncbi:MAG: DUF721 domain-containing protein [Hyphomicrobiaceae bacterium]
MAKTNTSSATNEPAARLNVAASPKRRSAMQVGALVPSLTKKAYEKFGFASATLISDWPAIVGPDLAAKCEPERLRWPRATAEGVAVDPMSARPGAQLVLRVPSAFCLDIQYRTDQIASRVNSYFGYRAVESTRIVQGELQGADSAQPRLNQRVRDAFAEQVPPQPGLPSTEPTSDRKLERALEVLQRCIEAERRAT